MRCLQHSWDTRALQRQEGLLCSKRVCRLSWTPLRRQSVVQPLNCAPFNTTSVRSAPTFADLQCHGSEMCLTEEDGAVLVRDDLDALLKALPEDIRSPLIHHPNRKDLLEVVLDLGRQPEARFLGRPGGELLREAPVTAQDLQAAEEAVGAFGRDNRAGIAGTLHRISAIRNRRGTVIGLTCRIGRAVSGHADMLRDLVESQSSILLLGRPGVGKTTVIREIARLLSDELRKRVVIVDTSNEIGGDGDVPHPAIGGARRMQVPDPSRQHHVMIEAVENHTPEVIIVDEIGSEAEALACRTIAERGITLIGTAHGRVLDNLMQNPSLNDLVGGITSVTLGDDAAKARGTKKTVLERKAPATFPIVVEIRDRSFYVAHWTESSVDHLLQGKVPSVQVRERNSFTHEVQVADVKYSEVTDPDAVPQKPRGQSVYEADYQEALATQRRAREAAAAALVAATAGTVAAGSYKAVPSSDPSPGFDVLNNAVPWKSRDGSATKSNSSLDSMDEMYADLVRPSAGRGFGASQASSGQGSRGFGAPVASGSGFMKPHVSVMMGRQSGSGGGRRGKGRAAARKLR